MTGNAITLNLLVGILLSTFLLIFGGTLLTALNVKGDILVYAKSYIHIVGGGIFLQALINALATTIRTHGFTKQTMVVSLLMNIIHVVGNYLLIYGHFGLPALGVEGAAISTVVSRFICLIIFFLLLYRVMEVRVKLTYYIHLSKNMCSKFSKSASRPRLNRLFINLVSSYSRCILPIWAPRLWPLVNTRSTFPIIFIYSV